MVISVPFPFLHLPNPSNQKGTQNNSPNIFGKTIEKVDLEAVEEIFSKHPSKKVFEVKQEGKKYPVKKLTLLRLGTIHRDQIPWLIKIIIWIKMITW